MPKAVVSVSTKANPEVVYSLLVDLDSHLVWNGERQAKDFRITSLKAPAGPATAGTTFESTGLIPFSSRTFDDRSVVTVADRPRVFEFRTESRVQFQNGQHMEATLVNRYEVEPTSDGSRITFTLEQQRLQNGMWRLAMPVLRTLTWKFGIPAATKRGVQNLAAMAEERQLQDRSLASHAS